MLYTGRAAWKSPRSLLDLLDVIPELLPFTPHCDILFLGLRDVDPAVLKSVGGVGWALRAVQRISADAPEFAEVVRRAGVAIQAMVTPEWRDLVQFLTLLVRYRRPVDERAGLRRILRECAANRESRKEFDVIWKSIAQEDLERGWHRGLKAGHEQGRREGQREGREEGALTAYRRVILQLGQQRLGRPSPALRRRLEAVRDVPKLVSLSRRVLDAESWSDLFTTSHAATRSRRSGRAAGNGNGRKA